MLFALQVAGAKKAPLQHLPFASQCDVAKVSDTTMMNKDLLFVPKDYSDNS
jgi:hypothetical protein